ncbi:mariner-Tc1 transposon family protein [Penicillium crustosum]|uniref:mariner-Tc1 transposon family protein n=1 Tax=Penicillium crustosum TaxID=36656 RepID=UPI0023857339|nr:mariner-Tc1 transposon family protein [Penicillium crustosum]KAJ5393318.1 mariner-Tc1 transposon family protein [Penicillium crustosum]
MDGSDKVPLWFIGQAQKPHAIRRTNINIQNLGVYWRANKKAWMVSSIMEEWLRWFDLRMAGRLSLRGAEIPIQAEDTTILDIEAGLQRLSFISAIENPMDIQHFLNPEEEIVTDSSESIDLQILAQFQAPDDEEEEEDPEVMPKVSSASALEAVQLLQLYQEQQEEGDIKLIHTLNKLRMEIQGGHRPESPAGRHSFIF